MVSVAQICNLLYRRIVSCRIASCTLFARCGALNWATVCRLQIGDTADFKSALRAKSGLSWTTCSVIDSFGSIFLHVRKLPPPAGDMFAHLFFGSSLSTGLQGLEQGLMM